MKTERELFLYELEGRGYTFENTTWLGNCFEDDLLNMAWEMWCASASREGYKLVPLEPTEDMLDIYESYSVAPIGRLSKRGYKAMINSI